MNDNGTASVISTGTVANLNAGLQCLTVTPLEPTVRRNTLIVTKNEQGNTGFFFQPEDGIRDASVTGVQTCALPISFQFPPSLRRCSFLKWKCKSARTNTI